MAGSALTRVTVLYSGHVQGVGFRYTVCRVAEDFSVTGRVRNLADGRVELVAEGAPDQVEGLLSGVAAAMEGYIRGAQRSEAPPTGEFPDFGIGR